MFNDTRWTSSFNLLTRALELKNEIQVWCSENEIPVVPDGDWEEISNLQTCLQTFADLVTFLQAEKYSTIWMVIASYNKMFDSLDDLSEHFPNSSTISNAFNKLKKYYGLTNDCPANFIATILCSKFKMNYYEVNKFDEEMNQIKAL